MSCGDGVRLVPDSSAEQPQEPEGGHRLRRTFTAPNSYGLVLLLILATYGLSVAVSASWAASLVVAVQMATAWVTLRATRARRPTRLVTNAAMAVAAVAAIANLFFRDQLQGGTVVWWVSCLLYLIAPISIVRHLVLRRVVDGETVLGAIAAYLMTGMLFAFLYHSVGLVQSVPPFFGAQGPGKFPQDLFFSFTTLTTTGYGDLIPAANPGQALAVAEMVIGQLFLVTAVGKVVTDWRPGQGRRGLRADAGD
jgi:Ion channel